MSAGNPVGIITSFDLVEQLDAAMQFASAGSPLPADLAARWSVSSPRRTSSAG